MFNKIEGVVPATEKPYPVEIFETKMSNDFKLMWGEKAFSNCKKYLDPNSPEDATFFENYVKFGYYAIIFIFRRFHPSTNEIRKTMEDFFEWIGNFIEKISEIENEKVKKQLFKKVRDFIHNFVGLKTFPEQKEGDTEKMAFFTRYVWLGVKRQSFLEIINTISPTLLVELALVPSLDEVELEQYSHLNFESLSLSNQEDLTKLEVKSDSIKNILRNNWQDKSSAVLISHLTTLENDIKNKNEKARYYLLESTTNKVIGFVRFQELEPGFVKGGMFNVDEESYGGLSVAMKILKETLTREMKSNTVVGTGGINDIITRKYIESFNGIALKTARIMNLDLFEIIFNEETAGMFKSKKLTNEEILELKEDETGEVFSKTTQDLANVSVPKGYALTRCIPNTENTIRVVYERIPEKYDYLVDEVDRLLNSSK